MATTQEYLSQLQTDKQTLVDNLVTKGVSASNDETFTSLVPKVLDIPSGSGDLIIDDASYLFYEGARVNYLSEILSLCKNVTDTSFMFTRWINSSLPSSLDLSNFDTSSVTTMNNMFNSASQISELNLSNWDLTNVLNISGMFAGMSNIVSLDVSSWKNTAKIMNMNNTFASMLRINNINLGNFDTSSVTNMSSMFSNCPQLIKADISSFTSEKLTNNSYMFGNCAKLTTLIINNSSLFKMTNANMFQDTPIASGTGYVYVPDNMVETYKSATNWSTYADQIKGMSELPVGDE